jgi:hypothetical protein
MRNVRSILLVAALAACGSGDPQNTRGLALGVGSAPPEPGEEVSLVLQNGTTVEVTYNPCTARLTQQRGEHWVSVASHRGCSPERQTLVAGEQGSIDFPLPENLAGGSYRFSMRVEVGGGRIQEIYSRPLQMPEPIPADTAEANAGSEG